MKRLLFLLVLLPQVLLAQDEQPFEGFKIKDCYDYVSQELAKPNGILHNVTKGSVTNNTKTIYISKQDYLGELPDTANGKMIKQIDVQANMKTIAKEVKKGDAAVFHITNMILRPDTCDIWVFPMELQSSMFKSEVKYSEKGCKAKFFFNQAPPKFIFRRVDCQEL